MPGPAATLADTVDSTVLLSALAQVKDSDFFLLGHLDERDLGRVRAAPRLGAGVPC